MKILKIESAIFCEAAEEDIASNYFDFELRQSALLIWFVSLFLLFVSFSPVTAQPTDCASAGWKGEYCQRELEELLRKYKAEIKTLDEKIAAAPNDAYLYYRRGKIYSEMMFEKGLGFKNVEFNGVTSFSEIDKKAVADYTRAINISPKPEYFLERGIVYRRYWENELSRLNFSIYAADNENKPRAEILKIVEKTFLNNYNFNAAESDFQKAVELDKNSQLPVYQRGKLAFLHGSRASILGSGENYFAAAIGNENAADVALADQDYEVDFYKKLPVAQGDLHKRSIYDGLLQKGRMAKNFGRANLALEIFNEAKKYWVVNDSDCFVYTYRAEIFIKRNNIESALGELTTGLDSGSWNCRPLAELRGDIYFRRGVWESAIRDYTAFLNNENIAASEETHIKRGKAYLNLQEGGKAVADFDYVINELFSKSCPQYFQMRAEGYKLSGKNDLAYADEKTARDLPGNAKDSRCRIKFWNVLEN